MHAVTAQHPQASFHKALLFPDKNVALSVILIDPCQLCTDQTRQTSANGPLGGCFTECSLASAQRDSCLQGSYGGGSESLPGLPAGPPRGMGKARGPHRATLGLKTSTSTQRHKVCHLASGGPPITTAPKKGIKVLDLLTEQVRMWMSPMQKCFSNVKADFSSCGP